MRSQRVAGATVVVALIAAMVLSWMAEPAYAVATRDATASLPLRQTVWSDTLRLAAFDPTLGELVSAEITLQVDARIDATIENTAAGAEPALPVRLGGRVRLTPAAALVGLGLPATITAQRTTTLALSGFDGVDDGGGSSGRRLVDEDVTTTFRAEYRDPDVLAALVGGTGDGLRVTVAASGIPNAAFAVNGRAEFRTEVALRGSITYTYLQPSFELRKSAVTPAVTPGGTARFLISVSNTGETALRNVMVSDAQAPGCSRDIGELPLGVRVEYACTMDVPAVPPGTVPPGTVPAGTASTVVNTVTASASSGAVNLTAEASATVAVGTAELEVIADPPSLSVPSGSSALFGFTIGNTGSLPLREVLARLAAIDGCASAVAVLAPGERTRVDCRLDGVTGSGRFTLEVVAQSDLGPVAAAAAVDLVVEQRAAALELQTTIGGRDADTDADAVAVEIGAAVPVEAVVTNTGAETLTELLVHDELAGRLHCPVTTLAPAASVRCTGSIAAPVGFAARSHLSTAHAFDPARRAVSAQDRTVHRGTRQTVCRADADLLIGLRFKIGDGAEVRSLAALRPRPNDRLIVTWDGYRAGAEGCRVTLAQHDTEQLVFDAGVEQPLVGAVSCTDDDCRSAAGYRLELVVADTGGPNQFDLVTGAALASVGPRGGYYSSALNGGLHRLLDYVTW